MSYPMLANRRPDGHALFTGAFTRAARPRRRLAVSEHADMHRMLTSEGSSLPGPWRTWRTPYLREPMDCLSLSSPVQTVVLMFPTQVGKTEVGLNWIQYVMDHAPAPMLIVVPTLLVLKRWVRQRLDPMMKASRVISKLFDAKRTRDAANSEDMKVFPGGFLVLAGANSPASLASMPIKYVINDEVDRFPWEVGKKGEDGDKSEGDPLGLIRQRQKTFTRHKKELLLSSPTMKDASRIEEEFLESDQRYYHVPCPHCDHLQALKWKNLKYRLDAQTKRPIHAAYACESCDREIEEHHKTQMLARGVWIPKNPGAPKRGYHLNALYAPLGLGDRWIELVAEWLAAQADKAKLKRFINTVLAETYEDKSRDVKVNTLKARAEPYGLREIPPGCLILTCGVDTQGDRLAVQVLGWGREETCWVIDWFELPGDPARTEVWAALAEYLNKPLVNRFGKEMVIQATAVDTGGHHTHDVYNFVRSGAARRLMAIKGSNTPSRPILGGRPQPQDVNYRNKVIKDGVKLWMVGTDTAKHALVARLIGDGQLLEDYRTDDEMMAAPPALKIHFSEALDDDYYHQLTSEVFDPERNKWVKRRGRRNEGLDTWVYAAAAAQHPRIRVHAYRKTDWDRLQQLLEPPTPSPQQPAPPPPVPVNDRSRRRVLNPGIGKRGHDR